MPQPLSNRYPHATRQLVNRVKSIRRAANAQNCLIAFAALLAGFALFA